MAAFLGEFLILDLDADHPRLLVAADGMVDIEQSAIAGVGVGDHARATGAGQRGDAIEHLAVGRNAGVGQAEGRRRHPIAGGIDEIEADLVGDDGRNHVVNARRHDERAGLDGRAQAGLGHAVASF